jgi:aldose 1-epimerase
MAYKPYPYALNPARFDGCVGLHRTALFLLRNTQGMVVAVTNVGAKVLQILAPDRNHQLGDVTLGYDSLDALLAGTPSMGAFIGRYAGRIGNACFTLDATTYQLSANAGSHCLHGGAQGSRHQVFKAQQTSPHSVELQHQFKQALDGFPGDLELQITYTLGDDNTLTIRHYATTAHPSTPASFTSHIFFNLDGKGFVDQHLLSVQANRLLQADSDNVCNGALLNLQGHPLDLRPPRAVGDIPALDHAYITATDTQPSMKQVAQLSSTRSGRSLAVYTNEPVLQVYGGGSLAANGLSDIGKRQQIHAAGSAICLEPQQYPNAPNCPSLPLNCVTPSSPYTATTRYCFGVAD